MISVKKIFKQLLKAVVVGYSCFRVTAMPVSARYTRSQQYSKFKSETQVITKPVEKIKKETNNNNKNVTEEDLNKLQEIASNKLTSRKLKRFISRKDQKVLKPVFKNFISSQYINRETISYIRHISKENYNNLINYRNNLCSNILTLQYLKNIQGGEEAKINAIITSMIIIYRIIVKIIEKLNDLVEIIVKGLTNFIANTIKFLKTKYDRLSYKSKIVFNLIVFSIITYYFYTIDLMDKIFSILSKNKMLSKILNIEYIENLKPKTKKKFREMIQRNMFEISLKEGIFPANGGYFLNKNLFSNIFYIVNPYIFNKDYVTNVIKGVLYIYIKNGDIGSLLNAKINWKSWINEKNCSELVKNFYNTAIEEAKEIVYNNLPIEKSNIWRNLFGYDCYWLKNIMEEEVYQRIKSKTPSEKERFFEENLIKNKLYDSLANIGLKIPKFQSSQKLTDLLRVSLDSLKHDELKYKFIEPVEKVSYSEDYQPDIKNNKSSSENENIKIDNTNLDNIDNKKIKDFDSKINDKSFKIEQTKIPEGYEDTDYIDLDLNQNKKNSNN